jgi:hypothetical protein
MFVPCQDLLLGLNRVEPHHIHRQIVVHRDVGGSTAITPYGFNSVLSILIDSIAADGHDQIR